MDPTALQPLPRSEYRKRRKYWVEWRKATYGVDDTGKPVTVEKTGIEIESDAVIIER